MSDERPAFAHGFPRTPAVDALVAAFARGDYAYVRAEAPRLERASDDDAERDAARTLVDRTKPDPLAALLLLVAGVLLVALTTWWIVHGKAPAGGAPPARPVEHVP
jgi:hypothetical protein